MTPTSRPMTDPVASIDIDFGARTITLTPPIEPRGVQITIASGCERPNVTVPVRDLSHYDEALRLKNRPA